MKKDPITIDYTQYQGEVRTRSGYPARIIAKDKKGGDSHKKDGDNYPIIALVEKVPGCEHVYTYNKNGQICAAIGDHSMDLEPYDSSKEISVTVNVSTDRGLLDKAFYVYAHAMIDGYLSECNKAEVLADKETGDFEVQLTFKKREGTA